MRRYFKLGSLVMLFLNFACIGNNPPRILIPKELAGLNGPSYYYFNEAGQVQKVIQKQHANKVEYEVGISQDTLELGQTFSAQFVASTDTFRVLIDEPRIETITGIHTPRKSPYLHVSQLFEFETSKKGILKLKGRIEFDTTSIPFEYKCLVK